MPIPPKTERQTKVSEISMELAALRTTQEQYEKRISEAYENAKSALRGDTRTFRYITTFLGFGAILIAGVQYLNADKLNTTVKDIELRADKEMAAMHKQVDEATKGATINSARVAPLPVIGSNGGLVSFYLDATTVNQGLRYSITFTTNVSVTADGSGIGKIVGYYTKVTGPIIEVLSRSAPSHRSTLETQLGAGDTFAFEKPLLLTNDGQVQFVVRYQLNQHSCEEAEATLEQILAIASYKENFGTLVVAPIFEAIKVNPQPKDIQLKLADNVGIFDCKALQRYDRPQESVSPSHAVTK